MFKIWKRKSVTSHLRPHRSHAESSSALPGSASIPSAEGTTLQYTRKESRQATRDKDTTDIPQMENKGHLAQNLQSRGSSPGLNRVTRDLKPFYVGVGASMLAWDLTESARQFHALTTPSETIDHLEGCESGDHPGESHVARMVPHLLRIHLPDFVLNAPLSGAFKAL
eukprot:TCALIF_09107-PA protein Name:"Protein of unknown function" AED:0.06 eAED:0.06 QI:0/0/0.25/0.5/0/0.25/4/0/167